jgi:competence protein ComEC
MGWRYYGPVEGTIVEIDRSASDKPRITLEAVVLRDVSPERTPRRVRLSLHGDHPGAEPVPGLRVMTTGHLSPPSGPVEPGAFDFQRHSWFAGLGAVGYARVPLLVAAPAEGGARLAVTRIRMALSAAMQRALPGETGAFAAAVTTGDRSGMGPETIQTLRDSNLAHLLAISGLHMGLLTGFVFASFRMGLALVPPLALRVPAKKVAAVVALGAATIYLALSGGAVATERAYIMAVVMLVAVLLDRRAISLRSVALAAVIVLLLRPEALTGPGFQMSFAATLALVAVFDALRRREPPARRLPGWLRPVAAVLLTSFVAGMATAPFSAAHFNQTAHYGLMANLLSVPVMGSVVIPAAVVAALLWPLGLAPLALWVMGLGIDWILLVADRVASLGGAITLISSPPAAFLPIFSAGAVALVLWRGPWRLVGLAPMALAGALWVGADRPLGLVSDTGGLVGWMEEGGRALSRERGDGFVAEVWLENDGDAATQEEAAHRRGAEGWTSVALPGGGTLHHLPGKAGPDRAEDLCRLGDILVLNNAWGGSGLCTVLDPEALRETGAVALLDEGGALRIVTSRERSGRRLWNDEDVRSRE